MWTFAFDLQKYRLGVLNTAKSPPKESTGSIIFQAQNNVLRPLFLRPKNSRLIIISDIQEPPPNNELAPLLFSLRIMDYAHY